MTIVKTPLISVVMSVYNDAKHVDTAIQSILDQSIQDFEFIIIDDGSSDNSKILIERYSNLDSRIKFLKNEVNKGLAYSLNRGIKLAKGKYIARMDADDISLTERFEKQLDFFDKYPDTDILGTAALLIDKNCKIITKKKMPISNTEMYPFLYFNSCFFHPSIMAKKSFFLPNNLYNEDLRRAQDWYLWVENFDNFKYRNLEDYLIKYRIDSSSNTNIYWNLKVLFVQGFKRKELMAALGIILFCLQYLKSFIFK